MKIKDIKTDDILNLVDPFLNTKETILIKLFLPMIIKIGTRILEKFKSKFPNMFSLYLKKYGDIEIEEVEKQIEEKVEMLEVYESELDVEDELVEVSSVQIKGSMTVPIISEEQVIAQELEIVRNANWSGFNGSKDRSRWFKSIHILQSFNNKADMYIGEGVDPFAFGFSVFANWLKGREIFVPVAIFRDGTVDRGNCNSHNFSNGFEYEFNKGIFPTKDSIKYFFTLRLKNGEIIGHSNIVEYKA